MWGYAQLTYAAFTAVYGSFCVPANKPTNQQTDMGENIPSFWGGESNLILKFLSNTKSIIVKLLLLLLTLFFDNVWYRKVSPWIYEEDRQNKEQELYFESLWQSVSGSYSLARSGPLSTGVCVAAAFISR